MLYFPKVEYAGRNRPTDPNQIPDRNLPSKEHLIHNCVFLFFFGVSFITVCASKLACGCRRRTRFSAFTLGRDFVNAEISTGTWPVLSPSHRSLAHVYLLCRSAVAMAPLSRQRSLPLAHDRGPQARVPRHECVDVLAVSLHPFPFSSGCPRLLWALLFNAGSLF